METLARNFILRASADAGEKIFLSSGIFMSLYTEKIKTFTV